MKAINVDYRLATADKNIHDDELLVLVRIDVPMHESGRNVKEVARSHHDSVDLSRAIFQPHPTSDLKAVQVS